MNSLVSNQSNSSGTAGDLFGHTLPVKPFKDIRNQRDSVAEQKAELCLQLKRLGSTVPDAIRGGSIQQTRAWMTRQEKAKKVLASSRSSVAELTDQIAQMRAYDKVPA